MNEPTLVTNSPEEIQSDIDAAFGSTPPAAPAATGRDVPPPAPIAKPSPAPEAAPAAPIVTVEELQKQIEELKGKLAAPVVEPKKEESKKVEAKPWQPKYKADAAKLKLEAVEMDKLIAGGDEALGVFNKFRDGIYGEMNELYKAALAEMAEIVVPFVEEKIRPFNQSYEQQVIQQHTDAFLKKHEDMKDYMDECRQVADAILANPTKEFKSVEEFYDEVASQTRIVVKRWEDRLGKKGGQSPSEKPVQAKPSAAPAEAGKARIPKKPTVSADEEDEEKIIEAVLNS